MSFSDYVVGGKAHNDMDLDIGLPKDRSLTAPVAMQALVNFASANGLRLKGSVNKGHHVQAAEFYCFDGRTKMSVEVYTYFPPRSILISPAIDSSFSLFLFP
jgi:hypothetical protein